MTIAQTIATHLLAAWTGAVIGVLALALAMGGRDGRD
jgi:hypothetical protein